VSWWGPDVLDRSRWQPLVEPVLDRAARALAADRFPNGLLLVGPACVGRELAAVEIAVLLVCAEADRPWVDGPCCSRVRDGIHPDVAAVLPTGAAEMIKIGQVREIVESAPARPYEGRNRVWILDGVEAGRFGPEAANAFLKVLEEPPEHVRFLLLAANPDSVLPTIRSRCQHLFLPGPAAIGRKLGLQDPPALVLAGIGGDGFGALIERARAALAEAFRGEVLDLLRLPLLLSAAVPCTEIVAAAAVEEASCCDDGERAAELVRLAGELIAVERRATALNLPLDRLLVSCLLRWWRELPAGVR
jgi:DNA polymerase-3 subunit delta'